MAATLSAPATILGAASAGAAWGFRPWHGGFEVVVRHGSGGPRRRDGLLELRSTSLTDDFTWLGPIPITTPERTLIDLAAYLDEAELRRAVKEAVRLKCTSLPALLAAMQRHRGRRGLSKLHAIIARYTSNVPHTTPYGGKKDVRA
jgi:hypothetical protein